MQQQLKAVAICLICREELTSANVDAKLNPYICKTCMGFEQKAPAPETPEAFQHRVRADLVTFVILNRKTVEDYEREKEARLVLWMKHNNVRAVVTTRRQRGTKTYTFYECFPRMGSGVNYSYVPLHRL
jgi:hypothetical protein